MTTNVTMEGKVSYFNAETLKSVEYNFSRTFASLENAKMMAPAVIETFEDDCLSDGGMPDTFYYEYDFMLDPAYAKEIGVF